MNSDNDPLSLYIMLGIGALIGTKAIWWSVCLVLFWFGLAPFDFLVQLFPAEWTFTRFDMSGPWAYCSADGADAMTDECIHGGLWTIASSIGAVLVGSMVLDKAREEGYTSIALLAGLLILAAVAPFAWAVILSVMFLIIMAIMAAAKGAKALGWEGFDVR